MTSWNTHQFVDLLYGPLDEVSDDTHINSGHYFPTVANGGRYYDLEPTSFFRLGGIATAWPPPFRGFPDAGGAYNGRWFCADRRSGVSASCLPPREVGIDHIEIADIPLTNPQPPYTFDHRPVAWPRVDFTDDPETPGGVVVVDPDALLDGTGINPPPDYMTVFIQGLEPSYESAHVGCYINPGPFDPRFPDYPDGKYPAGCGSSVFYHPKATLTIDGPLLWSMSLWSDDYQWGSVVEGSVEAVDYTGTYLPGVAGLGGVTGVTRADAPFVEYYPFTDYPSVFSAQLAVPGLHHPNPATPPEFDHWGQGYIVQPSFYDDPGSVAYPDPNPFSAALWPFGTFNSFEIDYGAGDFYGVFGSGMTVIVGLYWVRRDEPDRNPGNILIGPVIRGVRIRHRIVGRGASIE